MTNNFKPNSKRLCPKKTLRLEFISILFFPLLLISFYVWCVFYCVPSNSQLIHSYRLMMCHEGEDVANVIRKLFSYKTKSTTGDFDFFRILKRRIQAIVTVKTENNAEFTYVLQNFKHFVLYMPRFSVICWPFSRVLFISPFF